MRKKRKNNNNKKQKVDLRKQYCMDNKKQYKTYNMKNNDEILKKQYKRDTKEILSQKNSLYYQGNIEVIRKKLSQYYF